MNMILTVIGLSVFAIAVIMIGLHYRSKQLDDRLKLFYDATASLRHHIHTAVTKEEIQELQDELTMMKESFTGFIPETILNKEIELLNVLISKKMKKKK